MVTPELIDYIKNQFKLGRSEEVIKGLLKNAGWQEADINEAFAAVGRKGADASVPPLPQTSQTGYQGINSKISIGIGGAGASEPALASTRELLKNSWQIYKSRFWTLVGILLAEIIIVGGLIGLFFIIPSFADAVFLKWFFVFLMIPVIAAIIVWALWSQLALFCAIKDNQEFIGIVESYRRAWRTGVWSFFFLGILAVLIMFGGLVLLVIPGIIFMVWFTPLYFVLISEGHKGLNALLRSKEYVSGRWWKVFWRLIAIILIGLAISLLIGGINFLLPKTSLVLMIFNIINGIINALLGIFSVTYIFSLYISLRETRPNLVNQPVSGKKGFFIFCAILGLLAPILILIAIVFTFLNGLLLLNPENQFAQARDAQRINDLNNLKSAIVIYQNTLNQKLPGCDEGKIYSSKEGGREIDGRGWLPIDLSKIQGGSPLIILPTDPLNNKRYFYTYACENSNSGSFKLSAVFESDHYSSSAKNDDGNDPNIFEVKGDKFSFFR